MADAIKYNLTSAGRPVSLSNTRVVGFKNYACDHTKAEMVAAGYFNNCRADLSVNTIIFAVCDADGTPDFTILRCSAVPVTGNVTVVDLLAALIA